MTRLLSYWHQLACLLLAACTGFVLPDLQTATPPADPVRVPLGGNSWVTKTADGTARIADDGLTSWSHPATTIATYVRFEKTGLVRLTLNGRVPTGTSRIRITLAGQSKEFDLQGGTQQAYPVGEWTISKAGYQAIVLQGVRKTGATFADITDIGLRGDAVNQHTTFVPTNAGNFFHWGRRGPSVHLRYAMPDSIEADWFYNEITVPEGSDIVGSYYMANGFGEGYFGMQVNSATERRVLFSVWSPFRTDDPDKIPDDQKIRLVRKGPDVITNEFGNEGSGGQSYKRYNWVAGQTYKFLLNGHPDPGGYTTYTAYFRAPDQPEWQLIASFKRPRTTTYLTSLYSFLENFVPETGNVPRQASFSNQWIRGTDSRWRELTTAQFTADNTARKAYRMDYAGGLNDTQQFVLRNCGFFDTFTPMNTSFTRPARHQAPGIDVSTLP